MNAEKSETNYVDASAPIQGVPMRSSHLCCGCCCDTRRATIIVNIINVSVSVITLFSMGIMTSDAVASQFDDDTVKSEFAMLQDSAWLIFLISSLAIVVGGVGIYGAMKYNGPMVLVAGVWFVINAVLSAVEGGFGGLILSGFFAYPHFVFYQELRNGIMTEENYPNEKHSCCCV